MNSPKHPISCPSCPYRWAIGYFCKLLVYLILLDIKSTQHKGHDIFANSLLPDIETQVLMVCTYFTNPREHLFHIPQYTIHNKSVPISVLNGALCDIEQVLYGICEIGTSEQFVIPQLIYSKLWYFLTHSYLNELMWWTKIKCFQVNEAYWIYLHFILLGSSWQKIRGLAIMCLTHWPLGDVVINSKAWFSHCTK